MMNLLFIHGLPAVGKLTVARELSRLTGYKIFHNHLTVDLVDAVFEFGSAPFVELRENIWLSIFERAADEKLPGLIFTFAFENTVRERFIDDTLEAVESRDGQVLFIELQCDQRALEKRLVEPSRRKFGKLTSITLLNQLIKDGALDTPTLPRPNFIIDTTESSPPQTARLICKHLCLTLVNSPTSHP